MPSTSFLPLLLCLLTGGGSARADGTSGLSYYETPTPSPNPPGGSYLPPVAGTGGSFAGAGGSFAGTGGSFAGAGSPPASGAGGAFQFPPLPLAPSPGFTQPTPFFPPLNGPGPGPGPAPTPNDIPIPSCNVKTFYITITSTQVTPVTVYNTRTQFVSTTIHENIYSTSVIVSTDYVTETVTKVRQPNIVTHTEYLTATNYQTQIQRLTETSYGTKTETRTLTATEVEFAHQTRSVASTSWVTHTLTHTISRVASTYTVVWTTQHHYVTETTRVPNYVIKTITSSYPVYETVTSTRTRSQYLTETTIHVSTYYTTKCSSYPPRPPPHPHTRYGTYGGY